MLHTIKGVIQKHGQSRGNIAKPYFNIKRQILATRTREHNAIASSVQTKFTKRVWLSVSKKYLPTPERPIRKWNVIVLPSGTIPKKRQRHRFMLSSVDSRLIHAIKHYIHIRYHPRIPLEKLQQPPYSKHGSALHTRVVQIHEQLSTNDHDPESRVFLGLRQMGRGDPSPSPGLEVLMDPPEEFWAFLAGF